MKKEIYKEIEIPEGVEVKIEVSGLEIKGEKGTNKKYFDTNGLDFEKKDNKIIVGNKKATKREKKKINTIAAHIKNMIKGVREGFEYRLKMCFSHFPFTLEVSNNQAVIKNFLGEKTPRKIGIPKGVEVKSDKQIVIVSSCDKELAGQTAASLERITKVRGRDRRVFQDGIFMTNKAGREI
jgi:large subunit ribosomal protein L6